MSKELRVTIGCTALNGTSASLPLGSENSEEGTERNKSPRWSVVDHCPPGMLGHSTLEISSSCITCQELHKPGFTNIPS